jgi:hypothetical protein
LKDISFDKYENKSFLKINNFIDKYNINIIIHDTHFIKKLIEERKDLKHFLILRNSDLEYLYSIEKYLYFFKRIYIPHIKDELNDNKIEFYNKFCNIEFI